MAFTLSKAQDARRTELVDKYRDKFREYERIFGKSLKLVEQAESDINGAIASLNEVIGEMNEFIEEIKDNWQGQFDDKSETWQEGERGQAVSNLISEWETQFNIIDDVEFSQIDMADDEIEQFENLPSEPQ